MKIHDVAGWESFPSYLDLAVPRILDFLEQHDLKITFFIVGQDAALQKNQTVLRAIAEAGHEISNRSFHHDAWLHFHSVEEIEHEIVLAGNVIQLVTGFRPTGFRGSSHSYSPELLQVLKRNGYYYDASTFPTFLGPIARTPYSLTHHLSQDEHHKRKALFGGFRNGLQPLKPYRWQMEDASLIEIPITTLPILKLPIHFRYLLYLSSVFPTLGLLYFQFALWLCRLTRTQPSLLLHPLDFLSDDDVPELAFLPGMSVPTPQKIATLSKIMRALSNEFRVITLAEHAQQLDSCSLNASIPRINDEFGIGTAVG